MHTHAGKGAGGGAPPWGRLDFNTSPFLVIWETTQACDLACKHCRAEARPWRDPDELTTEEAKKLLDDVRRFGPIIFVFSRGDALKRPDIVELVRYGSDLGLRMAATPATTPLATPEIIHELRDAGLARLAVSLDGSCPEIHDEFRQVAGSFDEGIRILKTAPFDIKVTAAPHYQRVVLELKAAEASEEAGAAELDPMTSGTAHSYRDGIGRARNVNDGDGFLFVSHTGDIMPSGFLPIAAGNVRTYDLVDTYRNGPIFKELRDRTLLKGKCGVCEFRDSCGGSRARSWAVTGDYLAAEPYCTHIPDAWRDRKKVERELPMAVAGGVA